MSTEKKTPEIKQPVKRDITRSQLQSEAPQSAQETDEKEIGGFKDAGLPEPTRFGDWEVKGRCSDF